MASSSGAKMPDYKIYSADTCPLCHLAKSDLETAGHDVEVIDLVESDEALDFFTENGFTTVPQVFKGEDHIGGYEDLRDHLGLKSK